MFKKKTFALLVSFALLLCFTVGSTLSLLIDSDRPVTNIFTPSKVTTSVVEELDGSVKKDVKIKNTGDTTAWIRAYVVVTWQNDDGNIYGATPIDGTDYEIDWGKTNWLDGSDGFYYYANPVAAGKLTADNLIDFIEIKETAPDGYSLHVEIVGSGIQSKPKAAFDAWAPNSDIEWGENVLTIKN